jgi:DNA primase
MENNSKISDEDLKSVLGKVKLGSQNHYISDCPICGKTGHFYIKRNTQLWDCKKCGESGNIISLLIAVNKLFLLGEYKSIDREKITLLNEYLKQFDEDLDTAVSERKKPVGFKRVSKDSYLEKRKLTQSNFQKFDIGYSNLTPSLKDYVIFLIKEDNLTRGYVARLNWSKEKIKRYENETGIKKPRYRNDKGAKFSNLLFGYDEINENTSTVILVEGLIDKITLDNILCLDEQDEIKCCATFGKKISQFQILKLLSKNLKKVILIFDDDAIPEMKKYGSLLSNFFLVEMTYTIGKDINDSDEDDVIDMFNRLMSVEKFNRSAVKIKL